ncbi:MAG: hypothetical protein LW823_02015 [Rickettsiales bacterium]|jgi:hypothetical protein|nr:hypothetical protein [Rickettsiales bacterium]
MDIIGTLLSIVFISILIALAVTFGFAMLLFILAVAVVTAVLVLLRNGFTRWRFIKSVSRQEQSSIKVIDGDYKDITHKEP